MSALLELGAGFHPELSGRENVFLNAAILGMGRRDIAARFDEIVAFSGLETFIDQPVKTYSSGMYVRLAFSVAINVDPRLLIIDEVLAVGDVTLPEAVPGEVRRVPQRRPHHRAGDPRPGQRAQHVRPGDLAEAGSRQRRRRPEASSSRRTPRACSGRAPQSEARQHTARLRAS